MRPTYVDIDVGAFAHNLAQVRLFAPHAKILAVIKANAYGHGVRHFIKPLITGADAVGVACLEEALELREQGLTLPIILLEGFFTASELPIIVQHDFAVVIHHQNQLDILRHTKLTQPIKVWLKVDTGMHRLGFTPAEFLSAWTQLKNCPQVIQPLLMSHFSCADQLTHPYTQKQLEQFDQFCAMTQEIQFELSLANSAAILEWPQSHYHWVRPGILLYGISPFVDKTGEAYGLKPVMTLRSQIMAIRQLKQGESVGYGATWTTTTENSLIGVIPVGYGDGYPRHAKNGTPILVNGKEVFLAGRVSMDMLTVDLSRYPDTQIGDPVILWGKGLPIERVAQYADTIAYELVCGLNKRVHVCFL